MKKEQFDELLASVRQGASILKGEAQASRETEVAIPDVRAIRARYKLSQTQFAALIGISAATLRNWEQGRRRPEGPAQVLLRVAARHPEVVLEAVRGGKARKSSRRTGHGRL
jgi:putative transcriptional regulator